ncbi:MAG: hypothetical protein JNL44_15900 [Gemmatimonadetes bacterium]|nr:hypothetical protein [Gemmatimonadota bacterium]
MPIGSEAAASESIGSLVESVTGQHTLLIGVSHPPLPPGYQQESGMLVASPPGSQWSLSHLRFGDENVLTLDSMTHSVDRKAHWVIVGATVLPTIRVRSETVVVVDCFLDGKADASIVAIGRWVNSGPHVSDLVDLRFALRPDVSSRTFRTLPVDRVSCWVDEDRR